MWNPTLLASLFSATIPKMGSRHGTRMRWSLSKKPISISSLWMLNMHQGILSLNPYRFCRPDDVVGKVVVRYEQGRRKVSSTSILLHHSFLGGKEQRQSFDDYVIVPLILWILLHNPPCLVQERRPNIKIWPHWNASHQLISEPPPIPTSIGSGEGRTPPTKKMTRGSVRNVILVP